MDDAHATMARPDWRDPAAYAYTRDLTREGWAWEFLRRNPNHRVDQRTAAVRGDDGAASLSAISRWACVRFEDPCRDARTARVLWCPNACSHVLPLRVEADGAGTPAFKSDRLRQAAAKVVTHDLAQHILFVKGSQRLQVVVRGGNLFTAQRLFTDIPSAGLEPRMLLLRRFNQLAIHGDLPPARPVADACARRLLFVLRALDGAAAAASQQEIAETLFSARDITSDWDAPTGALRHQVRRAISRGAWLRDGGYLRLLR